MINFHGYEERFLLDVTLHSHCSVVFASKAMGSKRRPAFRLRQGPLKHLYLQQHVLNGLGPTQYLVQRIFFPWGIK
jgi:hypothetical protein